MIIQPDATRSIAAARAAAGAVPRQLRYAASLAINAALGAALRAERTHMQQVFDRPTPYVVRGGVALTNSSKDNLVGIVALATSTTGAGNLPPGKPLLAEVQGGARRAKRSELLLQRAGILPTGWLMVPGKAARMDGYGNISRSQILEVLAWFKTFGMRPSSGGPRNAWRDNLGDKGRARKIAGTRNRFGREFFAVKPGDKSGLKPGIYVRELASRKVGPVGNRPRAVLVFVSAAHYRERVDFVDQAEAAVIAAFPAAFRTGLRRALETAQ